MELQRTVCCREFRASEAIGREQRCQPGRAAENEARGIVRSRFLDAMSAYCEDGAVMYDGETGKVLTATTGDCAVEIARQDAARRAALP